MGTEALWVPLLLSAAGAGATAYNTNRTLKKQDQAAAEGIRRQQREQQEANAKIRQTIKGTEGSTAEEHRASANQQYLDTIQKNMGMARAGLMPAGTSSVFDTEAQAAQTQQQGLAENVAGLMARMDAPGMQRQREAASYGNLGMDLDRIGAQAQGQEHLNRLRVAGVRRNPWLDAAGAALSGAGSGMGYSAGYGSGGGKLPAQTRRYP